MHEYNTPALRIKEQHKPVQQEQQVVYETLLQQVFNVCLQLTYVILLCMYNVLCINGVTCSPRIRQSRSKLLLTIKYTDSPILTLSDAISQHSEYNQHQQHNNILHSTTSRHQRQHSY